VASPRFSGSSAATAAALIDRIGTELATWRIVQDSDRVEAAALTFAEADLRKLA
jgi:hypothetical protein